MTDRLRAMSQFQHLRSDKHWDKEEGEGDVALTWFLIESPFYLRFDTQECGCHEAIRKQDCLGRPWFLGVKNCQDRVSGFLFLEPG